MLRKILIIGACMLIFPCAMHPANAADMPTVEYSHTVDFEANDPRMRRAQRAGNASNWMLHLGQALTSTGVFPCQNPCLRRAG